jgi:hypothetical protein
VPEFVVFRYFLAIHVVELFILVIVPKLPNSSGCFIRADPITKLLIEFLLSMSSFAYDPTELFPNCPACPIRFVL